MSGGHQLPWAPDLEREESGGEGGGAEDNRDPADD